MRQIMIVPVLVSMCLFLAACQQTSRPTAPPQVKIPGPPDRTLVGYTDILKGEESVGFIKTYRYEDGSGQRVGLVFDKSGQSAGYILEDGRSFRHTVHDGLQPVSESSDLWRNAAAVLGMAGTRLQTRVVADVDTETRPTFADHGKKAPDDEG